MPLRRPVNFLKIQVERLRNVFLLVFVLLIVTIIFTPLIIKSGISIFSEEVLESILLLVQVSVAWNIFRLYERTVKYREEEAQKFETEYQKREQELLEAFAYLGKVNVQVSLIKSFLGKLKSPTNKREMKECINEILRMALSISNKEWMTLRIIHPEKFQTISEHWVKTSPKVKTEEMKIGNREIVEITKDKRHCNEKGYCVLSSAGSAQAPHKTFLVFREEDGIDQEVLDFLKAAVNQCEIIFTLFSLRNNHQ